MQPVINITGGATFHIVPDKPQGPTIPVTPFVKATFMEVDGNILVFGAMLQKELSKKTKEFMATEAFEDSFKLLGDIQKRVSSDYNTDQLTDNIVVLVSTILKLGSHYGMELKIPNG